LPQAKLSESKQFMQIKIGNPHTIGELIGSMAHRQPHVQSTIELYWRGLAIWVGKKDISQVFTYGFAQIHDYFLVDTVKLQHAMRRHRMV
jgi:hypothetical protein